MEIKDVAKPLPSTDETPKIPKAQTTGFAIPETYEDEKNAQENSSPISTAFSIGNSPADSNKDLDNPLRRDMTRETSVIVLLSKCGQLPFTYVTPRRPGQGSGFDLPPPIFYRL